VTAMLLAAVYCIRYHKKEFYIFDSFYYILLFIGEFTVVTSNVLVVKKIGRTKC
jgi:hypothetical protein